MTPAPLVTAWAWARVRALVLQTHAPQALAAILGGGAALVGVVFLVGAPRFLASPVLQVLVRPPLVPFVWGALFLTAGSVLLTVALVADRHATGPMAAVGFLWFLLAFMSVPDAVARGTGLTFALAVTLGLVCLVVTTMVAGQKLQGRSRR